MYAAKLFALLALVAQATALPVEQHAQPVLVPIRRGDGNELESRIPSHNEAEPEHHAAPVHIPIRRGVAQGLARRTIGEVLDYDRPNPYFVGGENMINHRNVLYSVEIQIGFPAQSFVVQLDTGSNGLWVHSENCGDLCPISRGFNRTASRTYSTTGQQFRMSYVVTHIQGEVGTDMVSMGAFSIPNQSFGVALDSQGTGFKNTNIVGILGMAFPSTSNSDFPNTTPLWQNAMNGVGGRKWPKPMFGMALTAEDNQKMEPVDGGKLTLGGVDASEIQGGEEALHWLPVVTDDRWDVDLDDLVIAGQSVLSKGDETAPKPIANFDSGTSGIMGPFEAIRAMWARVPGAFLDENETVPGKLEYYRYPCDSPPDVSLTFGSEQYHLTNTSMFQFRGKYNESSTEETCFGNIFGWSNDRWILGDNFFHSTYLAFRNEPRSIGIGRRT